MGLNNFKLFKEDRLQQTAATMAGKPRKPLPDFKSTHSDIYILVGSIDPFVAERTMIQNR